MSRFLVSKFFFSDDMEYADMPPLTDGGSVSSACNNIHYMGGASRPSISVAPPSHYKDGGNQPNQFTWNNGTSSCYISGLLLN